MLMQQFSWRFLKERAHMWILVEGPPEAEQDAKDIGTAFSCSNSMLQKQQQKLSPSKTVSHQCINALV